MKSSLKVFLIGVICISKATFSATSTTTYPDNNPPECPTPDAFIPHEDCTLYWQCSNSVPNLMSCSPGLYFSPPINGCDFPANVPECQGGTRPPIGTTTTVTPGPSTKPPSTERPTEDPATQPPSTERPTEDPATQPPSTQVPPQPTTSQQPSDAPSTEASTDATTPETSQPPTTEPPTPSTTEEQPNPTTESSRPPSTAGPTTESPPETTTRFFCPPNGIHDFPYPGNCSLYIRCIFGTPFVTSCAEDLLFDIIDRICKPAADAICDEEPPVPTTTEQPPAPSTTTESPTTGAPEFTCPPQGYHTFPHPRNCSLYYLCFNGNLFIEQCAFGTYYDADESQQRCNLAELVQCNADCPAEGLHYLPIPTSNCRHYKICFDGDSVNFRCADGTIYNPSQQMCVTLDSYTCPWTDFQRRF